MARSKSKPKSVEPEVEIEEVAADVPEPDEAPTVSKAEAVRQALDAGVESPNDGVEFIAERFGIEMTKTHFSAAKSLQKKREGKPNGKPGRKPNSGLPASRVVEGYLVPSLMQHTNPSSEILEAMESLKPMIARMGADKVKRIVDLLG